MSRGGLPVSASADGLVGGLLPLRSAHLERESKNSSPAVRQDSFRIVFPVPPRFPGKTLFLAACTSMVWPRDSGGGGGLLMRPNGMSLYACDGDRWPASRRATVLVLQLATPARQRLCCAIYGLDDERA